MCCWAQSHLMGEGCIYRQLGHSSDHTILAIKSPFLWPLTSDNYQSLVWVSSSYEKDTLHSKPRQSSRNINYYCYYQLCPYRRHINGILCEIGGLSAQVSISITLAFGLFFALHIALPAASLSSHTWDCGPGSPLTFCFLDPAHSLTWPLLMFVCAAPHYVSISQGSALPCSLPVGIKEMLMSIQGILGQNRRQWESQGPLIIVWPALTTGWLC